MALALRYAARSDVGLVRSDNQDSGYAGPRLLLVADGMGGHAAGDVASSITVAAFAELDEDAPGPDLLDQLAAKVEEANERLREIVEEEPGLEGMGTTLTALLRAGSRLGLVHVGDSRAYLLRDGQLSQITRDDTLVQELIDEGRITPEEASHHPQRSLITLALDGRTDVVPHLSVREAVVGDRYMLCSDGLSGVVSEETMAQTLTGTDPASAVDRLVELALRGGGPDNITCIVADIVEVSAANPSTVPQVVGAASSSVEQANRASPQSPAARAAALAQRPVPDAGTGPGSHRRAPSGRWVRRLALSIVVLAAIGGAGWGGWSWSQRQYYVGDAAGQVAIFRGLSQSLGELRLSRVYETEDIPVAGLPAYSRQRVLASIDAKNLDDARRIVAELRVLAGQCPEGPAPTRAASPTPTGTAPTASTGTAPTASAGTASAGTGTGGASPVPSVAPDSGCGGSG